MFANLESFSIFFFTCLALIVLAIAFEDKLIALEKKHNRQKSAKRNSAKVTVRRDAHVSSKSYPTQRTAARNNAVPQRKRTGIAA